MDIDNFPNSTSAMLNSARVAYAILGDILGIGATPYHAHHPQREMRQNGTPYITTPWKYRRNIALELLLSLIRQIPTIFSSL